jgi:hypothetical protein
VVVTHLADGARVSCVEESMETCESLVGLGGSRSIFGCLQQINARKALETVFTINSVFLVDA